MPGFFGDMFDFNHDGELNAAERAVDFMMFEEMLDEEKKRKDYDWDEEDEDF